MRLFAACVAGGFSGSIVGDPRSLLECVDIENSPTPVVATVESVTRTGPVPTSEQSYQRQERYCEATLRVLRVFPAGTFAPEARIVVRYAVPEGDPGGGVYVWPRFERGMTALIPLTPLKNYCRPSRNKGLPSAFPLGAGQEVAAGQAPALRPETAWEEEGAIEIRLPPAREARAEQAVLRMRRRRAVREQRAVGVAPAVGNRTIADPHWPRRIPRSPRRPAPGTARGGESRGMRER